MAGLTRTAPRPVCAGHGAVGAGVPGEGFEPPKLARLIYRLPVGLPVTWSFSGDKPRTGAHREQASSETQYSLI
jgi:hypothetical protein